MDRHPNGHDPSIHLIHDGMITANRLNHINNSLSAIDITACGHTMH